MLPRKLKKGDKTALIFDRWNQLVDYLHEIRLVGGAGIRLAKMTSGTVISAMTTAGGGGGAMVDDAARGPFAVTIENKGSDETPEWTVRLHNSANTASAWAGMVTVGSRRSFHAVQTWTAKEGVVYLDVTYDVETENYQVLFALEVELPATADEKRFVLRITDIAYDSDADRYTATQIRPVGDIEVLGRWVK